ncbi:MAG: hypothetical protein ABI237_13860 [Ginsengibacter sp.]
MKIKHILLFGVVAALAGCSTAYRSGQTPDDVYYSPAPEQSSYVSSVSDRDRDSYSYRNDEDAQIRQGIQNPIYRSPISLNLGFGYGYNPYSSYYGGLGNSFYGYNPYGYKGLYNSYYDPYGLSFYNNPYSSYSPYSSLYSPYSFYSSPYYGSYYPVAGQINTNRGVRRYNLNAYNNGSTTTNPGSVGIRSTPTGTIQPSTSVPIRRTTGVGNVIRRVFSPSSERTYDNNSNNSRRYNNPNNRNDNSNNREYSAPVRTFNTPSVSTPSSSGSNNSSAPVRTFRR